MAKKTFLAIGCSHRPLHNEGYEKWLYSQIESIRPKIFVHCGDLFDAKCLGSYVQNDKGKLSAEYDSANSFLTQINDRLPRGCTKVYIEGNHCSRGFREQFKSLSELIDFRLHIEALKNYTIKPYIQGPEGVYRVGQVTFAHSWSTSDAGIKQEVSTFTRPRGLYVHSHTHRGHGPYQLRASPKVWLPWFVANTGCGMDRDLTDRAAYYHHYNTSAWTLGLIHGWVDDDLHVDDKHHWHAEYLQYSDFWGNNATSK